MIKRISQQYLALLLVVISLVMSAVAWAVYYLVALTTNEVIGLVVGLALCAGGLYFIFRRILTAYVHRRIHLIYKMIRKSGKDSNGQDQSRRVDELGRVESQVKNWIEEQTKELESLKQIESYRRNFLGNISHELKTPIFAVQGYIHTLLDGGLHDDQVNKHFLRKAGANIERLETIIEDLDIIARLEDATVQLELQNFDIKELTREVFDEVEVQSEERGIELILKDRKKEHFMVEADREYIRTVLVNLIVNSIKYGNEEGRTVVAIYDADDLIMVEIKDNGIGIEEKHLKHLFDRFYRVDKSRSRDKGGSGLGLSIVKHIIEVHNQSIHVKSLPGVGTTFSFTLNKAKDRK